MSLSTSSVLGTGHGEISKIVSAHQGSAELGGQLCNVRYYGLGAYMKEQQTLPTADGKDSSCEENLEGWVANEGKKKWERASKQQKQCPKGKGQWSWWGGRICTEVWAISQSLLHVQYNVSLPLAVIALLCMSGYLIWRNWKRKNTKSMNFDNPVYRKTTEEEDEDELHIGRTAQIGHVYPAVSIPRWASFFLPSSLPSFSPPLPSFLLPSTFIKNPPCTRH